MLITCPSCTTPYQIAAAELGAAGRSVRCVRCRTLWHATAPVSLPAQAAHAGADHDVSDETVDAFRAELSGDADPAPETSSPDLAASDTPEDSLDLQHAEADPHLDEAEPDTAEAVETASGDDADQHTADEIPADEAPPLAPVLDQTILPNPADSKPAKTKSGKTKPAKTKPAPSPDVETAASRSLRRARRGGKTLLLPLVIAGLVAALAGLLIGRNSVVSHAPQTASLYAAIGLPVNVRGLDFIDVRTSADTHDGVPVLLVEGAIVNHAAAAIKVPRLRFGVNNEAGNEIYAWTAPPAQPVLQPGETLPFRSRLASPPPEGRSVLVRFFHPRDAASGLR